MTPREQSCVSVEALRSVIEAVVKDAVAAAIVEHRCIHGLSPQDVQALRQVAEYLHIIGGGDTVRGAHAMREQGLFVSRFMALSGRVGAFILLTVTGAILALSGSAIVRGVIDFVREHK